MDTTTSGALPAASAPDSAPQAATGASHHGPRDPLPVLMLGAMGLAAVILGLLAALLISRSIVAPLQQTAAKTELTDAEREICAALGPELRRRGLLFVGIDVIGDWLTEINVTSPTGIQELERFDGTNTAEKIWQVIEAKRGL